MSTGSVDSSSSMGSIQLNVMKKAQDVNARAVLSVLDSAAAQPQQTSSAVAGIGKNLDIKA